MCSKRTDARSFFQRATLHICSSLEIEKAFSRLFHYIRDFIPAEEAYLHYYLPEIGASRLFVKADADGAELIDVVVLWPDELRRILESNDLLGPFLFNRADTAVMSQPLIKRLGKTKSSLMTLRLDVDRRWVGGVSFWAGAWDRFTQDDLDLLAGLTEPLSIALSNYRRYQEIVTLKDRLADEYEHLKEELTSVDEELIVGSGFGLKGVMEMVKQVAPHDSPVLVMGETGTGKELITRAIHSQSRRRDRAFVMVNCGAIAESLMDSELFGHEKGAFTGAINSKKGRFERAHRGNALSG